MSDRRDRNHRWYSSFDPKRMVITLEGAGSNGEDVEIPVVYEVCGTCEGKGTHVNPSIDSNGLSAEDFADDPDFAEDYFSGRYDQPCNECGGQRVVPAIDVDRAGSELTKIAHDWIESYYAYQRECEAERRMGA